MIPRELVCGMNVKEQISEEKIGNESRELSASLREQTASVHRIESNCRPNRFLFKSKLPNQNGFSAVRFKSAYFSGKPQ